MRSNELRVLRKLIMATAKYFYESECGESEKSLFVVSNGWVNNFMHPEWLIDKLILYILHARRLSIKYKYLPSSIIAMDETSICLKTTGHEKFMVSICFAAKADGTKLKPLVVFYAAKRESNSLDEEFESHCVVKSSGNAWMKEELITI